MATTKTTGSPRRAQLKSNSGLPRKRYRLTKPVDRLPVYENLFALNRDFEQVLISLARLEELGAFSDFGHMINVAVKRARAEVNQEIAAFLQAREEDAGAWWNRLHARWEKRMSPDDVLIEAKLLLAKRRKAAARKKSKRQGRGAGSKAV